MCPLGGQSCGSWVLDLGLQMRLVLPFVSRCVIFPYYTALQNVQKGSVDLNGPPQRFQVCSIISLYSLLRKCSDYHLQRVLCFVSSLSYHIISQVVRSFNVTDS